MDWQQELSEALDRDESGESVGVSDLVEAIEDLVADYPGLDALDDAVEAFRLAEFESQRWQGRVGYDADDAFRDAVHAFAREHGVLGADGLASEPIGPGFGP
jgi:hypothetical protein